MKKILLTLVLLILFIPGVNAEEYTVNYQDIVTIPSHLVTNDYMHLYQDFDTFISNEDNKIIFDNLYKELYESYLANYSKIYPYYLISVAISSTNSTSFEFDKLGITMNLYTEIPDRFDSENYTLYAAYKDLNYYLATSDDSLANIPYYYFYFSPVIRVLDLSVYAPLFFFNSNFDVRNHLLLDYSYSHTVIDSDGNTFVLGEHLPVMNSYTYDNYFTTVNLDDYEYVILSLKDYSLTQTFSTNLQVKGMIGITPVYEFGTVEKTEITDRCNISYSDYTNMRLYILKNDLINNPVYYVKSCEEGSSFKFDSSIFNITYITTDTVDNPVVTVGGTSYEVIPFNKLSTTANSNEENNFIPGESKNSLTDIIDNATDFTSDIWNAISSFMSLVTKFFNTLPEEFRYLSITAFTVLIFISIIKFIRG